MSSEQTIRQECVEGLAEHDNRRHALMCDWCHQKWPCDDWHRYRAILDTLDEAKRKFDVHGTAFRFVRDSEPTR